jgi:hypothetical protein
MDHRIEPGGDAMGSPWSILRVERRPVGPFGNWGPPWPTTPSFAPGLPASGSPLDVTFNATNASVLFPVPDLFVECEMVCLRASDSSRQPLTSGLRHVYVLAMGTSHLAPGQTMPFRCRLRAQFGLGRPGESDADAFNRITNAQIVLHGDNFNFWTLFLSRHEALSGRFSLNTKRYRPNGSKAISRARAIFDRRLHLSPLRGER